MNFSRKMKDMKKLIIASMSLALLMCFNNAARAIPTFSQWDDAGNQDPLWTPMIVHELGVNPPGAALFPQNELISAYYYPDVGYTPCSQTPDNPNLPNPLVGITNMTNISWTSVWYVADFYSGAIPPMTNDDGWINGGRAFKIDSYGLNTPLIYESIAFNGIFEPGETWEFVIQDYFNMYGLSPAAFSTVGVPSFPDLLSSGSIVAIPAPGAFVLCGLGASLVGYMRKRRYI